MRPTSTIPTRSQLRILSSTYRHPLGLEGNAGSLLPLLWRACAHTVRASGEPARNMSGDREAKASKSGGSGVRDRSSKEAELGIWASPPHALGVKSGWNAPAIACWA